jgi:hypothetical protein
MAFSIRHNFHFGIPAIISKLPAIKKGFEKLQHIFHCKRKAKSLSMIGNLINFTKRKDIDQRPAHQ